MKIYRAETGRHVRWSSQNATIDRYIKFLFYLSLLFVPQLSFLLNRKEKIKKKKTKRKEEMLLMNKIMLNHLVSKNLNVVLKKVQECPLTVRF